MTTDHTDIADVRRISVQPGDLIVVKLRHGLSANALERLKAHLTQALPAECKVIVLDEIVESLTVLSEHKPLASESFLTAGEVRTLDGGGQQLS